jgi:hypothetical protein
VKAARHRPNQNLWMRCERLRLKLRWCFAPDDTARFGVHGDDREFLAHFEAETATVTANTDDIFTWIGCEGLDAVHAVVEGVFEAVGG